MKQVKTDKDVILCIQTFNGLDTTSVEVSGNTLELMSIVGAALLRDRDLMDLLSTIVMSAKEFEALENSRPSDN